MQGDSRRRGSKPVPFLEELWRGYPHLGGRSLGIYIEKLVLYYLILDPTRVGLRPCIMGGDLDLIFSGFLGSGGLGTVESSNYVGPSDGIWSLGRFFVLVIRTHFPPPQKRLISTMTVSLSVFHVCDQALFDNTASLGKPCPGLKRLETISYPSCTSILDVLIVRIGDSRSTT